MEKSIYTSPNRSWHENRSQTVTFIVTEDCNLRCKYCYITHKKSTSVMTFEMGKMFIDKLLESDELRGNESLILDFIGGEPFLEVKLIDKLVDYFKLKSFILNHDWYWNYRINICTNGVNYADKFVQEFINKNEGKLSVSITIDGNKEKHDMNRVSMDNNGSFDTIKKNIPLWLSKFPGSTKVTFSSPDLPLLFESIVYLWNIGIKDISANVVFEDVWQKNDDFIFEEQLKKLADYIIENKTYEKGLYCSFFEENIGYPYLEADLEKTYCGAGKMLAFAPDGNIYPCIRYYEYSLNNHPSKVIGNVKDGIFMDKVRPFILATSRIQSDEECINCEIASGCAFCQGFNYDSSFSGTNFYRAKYICKMHKARVRANNYFFAKLLSHENYRRSINNSKTKKLYILMDNNYTSYCQYKNSTTEVLPKIEMNKLKLKEVLEYSRNNFYMPYIVHSDYSRFYDLDEYEYQEIINIIKYDRIKEAQKMKLNNIIPVISMLDKINEDDFFDALIFNCNSSELENLNNIVKNLFKITERVNLNILEINNEFKLDIYEKQLYDIADFIAYNWNVLNRKIELDILTDDIFLIDHDNCGAGDKSFVVAPNGEIYNCCGMYSEKIENNVGKIPKLELKEDKKLYKITSNNLCSYCVANHCRNCIYVNKISTDEVNVSPAFQCNKGVVELKVSTYLKNKIYNKTDGKKTNDYIDPINIFLNETKNARGFYK